MLNAVCRLVSLSDMFAHTVAANSIHKADGFSLHYCAISSIH